MKHIAYYPKKDWQEYYKGNLEPHLIEEKDIPPVENWIGFYDECDVYEVKGRIIVVAEMPED